MSTLIQKYSTKTSSKLFVIVGLLVGGFIIAILAVMLGMKASTANAGFYGVIGGAIVAYLTAFPAVSVYSDKISLKAKMGKAREFSFSEGKISLDEITGIKSFTVSFSSKSYLLKYHPTDSSKKTMPIPMMLPKDKIQEIYNSIPENVKA